MIIEVGKNYIVISVLLSALMEARRLVLRHEPVNSIFLDIFCFLVLSKIRLPASVQTSDLFQGQS